MQTSLYMINNLSYNKERFPLVLVPNKVLNCANNEMYTSWKQNEESLKKEFNLKPPPYISEPSKPQIFQDLEFEYQRVKVKKVKYGRFIGTFLFLTYLITLPLGLLIPFLIPSVIIAAIISLIIAIVTSIETDYINKKVPISAATLNRYIEHNKKADIDYKKSLTDYELRKKKYQIEQEDYKNKLAYYRNNYHLLKYFESIKPVAIPSRTQEIVNKGNTELTFLNK